MWVNPDVCRLVANNLGSFAINLGYTPSIVAVNLGNLHPMFAGRDTDVCKPLQINSRNPETVIDWFRDDARWFFRFQQIYAEITENINAVYLPSQAELDAVAG